MPEIWKEVIRPGEHVYIDPATSQPRTLTATADEIHYWHDAGKKMIESQLSIPVPMEHQEGSKPLTAGERAANRLKDNAGWIKDYKIGDVKEKGPDGKEVVIPNVLFGLHEIPDPSIAAKLPHTIRFSSPYISSFVDGAGREWNGVIVHNALTTRPRIAKQQPFANPEAALSIANSFRNQGFKPSALPVGQGFSLSRAGLLVGGRPAHPMAFSLLTGAKISKEEIRLALEEMKEKPKEKPKEKEGEKPPMKPEGEVPGGSPDVPGGAGEIVQEVESLVDADGDISIWDVICDLLESEGYVFPEGTTGENFAERCYELLMDKLKTKGMDDMPEPTKPEEPKPGMPPAKPGVVQEQPPIYMALSLEKIAGIADPVTKQIALSLYHTQQKNAALEQKAFSDARTTRDGRIKKLEKILTPEYYAKLVKQATDAKFSLGDDGVVKDDMETALDILANATRFDIPELLTSGPTAFFAVPHPREFQGEMTEEKRKELVDSLVKS